MLLTELGMRERLDRIADRRRIAIVPIRGVIGGAVRTDDLLLLENGALVEVVAAPEPLVEARAADLAGLARLAWHLGDRHIPVQVLPNRVRARRDAALEALLKSLGAKVTLIEAPFEPEGGAYSSSHDHGHAHHDHDHAHDHHGHSHGHHHDH